ncbi:hypothetical protein GGP69_003140 [Salinibacter ruber]|nr:hypothetical protein [Salinibacter ruber]
MLLPLRVACEPKCQKRCPNGLVGRALLAGILPDGRDRVGHAQKGRQLRLSPPEAIPDLSRFFGADRLVAAAFIEARASEARTSVHPCGQGTG